MKKAAHNAPHADNTISRQQKLLGQPQIINQKWPITPTRHSRFLWNDDEFCLDSSYLVFILNEHAPWTNMSEKAQFMVINEHFE